MSGNPKNFVLLNRKTKNNQPFLKILKKKIEMFGNPGNSVIPNGNPENSVLLNIKTKKNQDFF